jgi:glycosyltransferase involved in cell wall biosynthesis
VIGGERVLDVSVIVPARNAESMLEECLASIRRADPREIIVVDGCSTDGTRALARRCGARVLSDDGAGLPVARTLGARTAVCRRVALVDADVVLPNGALAALLEEFEAGGYTGLQAGLHSIGGPGYWGRALAHHHRTGRSRRWFGLVATIFDRDTLLAHGFDRRFLSGEDIELRRRLARQGAKLGVSDRTVVLHRFEDGFAFARRQFLADGRGLRRIWSKDRWTGLPVLVLPAAAALRGIALSVVRLEPQWVPYYGLFAVYNYAGMSRRPG